ncbi:hypothetical protein P8452_48344 [Trifolium repens]|nr:hypothetical protein P8452_48344 [Trifolium repens]
MIGFGPSRYRLTKVVQVYFVQNNTPSHFKLHFCSVLHYHEKVENCYTEKIWWKPQNQNQEQAFSKST